MENQEDMAARRQPCADASALALKAALDEVATLREALAPFARLAKLNADWPDEAGVMRAAFSYPMVEVRDQVRLAHLRHAFALLTDGDDGQSIQYSAARDRVINASVKLGAWMSAALDDPKVCDEMKADINEWFSAGEPVEGWAAYRTIPLLNALRNVVLSLDANSACIRRGGFYAGPMADTLDRVADQARAAIANTPSPALEASTLQSKGG